MDDLFQFHLHKLSSGVSADATPVMWQEKTHVSSCEGSTERSQNLVTRFVELVLDELYHFIALVLRTEHGAFVRTSGIVMNRCGHQSVCTETRDVRGVNFPSKIRSGDRSFSQIIHRVHSICYRQPIASAVDCALQCRGMGEAYRTRVGIVRLRSERIDERYRFHLNHECA